MVTPPTPNYDYNVKRLVKAYEKALKDVQGELDTLLMTDLKRAQIVAAEKQINAILTDLATYSNEWSRQSLDQATLDGIASSMYALGVTSTYEEALALARMSRTNRRLVDAAIADTQADLLAVTQNMNRQSKLAIRNATSRAMREVLTKGDNATSQLSRAIRNEILKTPNMAIIDASGRRWKVGHYTDVIARTNMMNAHREASIVRGIEEGALYGRISRHGAKDACAKWEGKIVKLSHDASGDFPHIDDLPRREIFHPQCKHLVTPVGDLSRLSNEIKRINGIDNPPPSNAAETAAAATTRDYMIPRKENAAAVAEFDRVTNTKAPLSSDPKELRKYMTELLSNSGIDAKVKIRNIKGAYGQVSYIPRGPNNLMDVQTFEINNQYLNRVGLQSTVYHEFYHARYDGLYRGKLPMSLAVEYEETATELAANYMRFRKGYTEKEVLSYQSYLTRNLPILKQVDEFKGLENVLDFGENFMKYRFDDKYKTGDWTFLADKMEPIKKTFNYDKYFADNYNDYIRENIDVLSADLSSFYGLKDASKLKERILNHIDGVKRMPTTYTDVIMMAMLRIGVK